VKSLDHVSLGNLSLLNSFSSIYSWRYSDATSIALDLTEAATRAEARGSGTPEIRLLEEAHMTTSSNGRPHPIEVTEIAAVSIAEASALRLRLLDADKREWVLKLPLAVLDAGLRRLPAERVLALNVETAEDHARVSCPKRAWNLSHDPTNPELTFACRTDDGHGIEISFDMDPLTAIPTLEVNVAAG
jgi:hypothetical protein